MDLFDIHHFSIHIRTLNHYQTTLLISIIVYMITKHLLKRNIDKKMKR